LVELGKEKRIKGSGWANIFSWDIPWDEVFRIETTGRYKIVKTQLKKIIKEQGNSVKQIPNGLTADQEMPMR
jgi:hypothetical protein